MNDNVTNNDTAVLDVELKVLFSDIWRGTIKFGWIVVALAIVFGGVQFYRSYVRFTPEYTVSATFTVQTENKVLSGENNVSAYSFFYNKNTAGQFADVFPDVVSNPILVNKVCEELGVAIMPASISAECISDTNMITLTATGRDPQLTYDSLQSVINNYSSVADHIIGRTKVVVIDEPLLPVGPSNLLAWRSSVPKAMFIGAFIGIGWIIVYAVLRKTIRTKEDIRNILNQHCIGVLPQVVFKKYRRQINTDIIITNPLIGNDFLESLRLLRTSIQKHITDDTKVIVITSTVPDEGKSVVTANLASIFAKNENRILVVDCDLRDSGIKELICESDQKNDVIKSTAVYEIKHIKDLGFDFLSFTNGERNLKRVIRTDNLKTLFAEIKNDYDLVFVDTPPCGIISDATIVAGVADAAIYVIRQDTVMQTSIRTGISSMLETETKLLGCILNGATGGLGGYGNYYKYSGYNKYYRYGYSRKYGYGYGYGANKKK